MESKAMPRRAPEAKSGGKMVRPRRYAVGPRTPYDRPRFPAESPLPQQQNPNWISRLILSPTRLVVSSTGKLLSSVFGPDSSSSSSASDSSSEDDVDDDIDIDDDVDDDNYYQEAGKEEKNGTPIDWRTETKHKIEQLIMQETFSREECDRLITTIKSRVIDPPTIGGTEDSGLIETPNKTVGNDVTIADLRSTAVMEARKWLEEKKSGSNSKSKLDLGTCTLNSTMLSDVTESEIGSPVDVARSYMQTRPAWASPTANHMESKSPLLTGIQLFKGGTPYSMGGNVTSSSKLKRDSAGTGSWNIMEEIRKVRSKATEEMLKTLPSSKIDWSSFASEHKSSPSPFANDRPESAMGNTMINSTKLVDTSLNLTTGVTSASGLPVSKTTQDGLEYEASPNPTAFMSGQNEDVEANRILEETKLVGAHVDGNEDTNGNAQHDLDQLHEDINVTAQHDLDQLHDSRLPDKNVLASQVPGTRDSVATNGLPSSGSSPVELVGEQNTGPHDEGHNTLVSGNEKINTSTAGETCELLSEASIEVPIINENDSVPSGSQNSSSMHQEGVSEAPTKPKSKRRPASKADSVLEKQQRRKISRYNRRGRGRSK